MPQFKPKRPPSPRLPLADRLAALDLVELRVHPRHRLRSADYALFALWQRCRGADGGLAHLPYSGGAGEQPAALMAAFDVLDHAYHLLKPKM